jgi:DNA invertase Pin-like site-specific DNA recombinase
MELRRPHIAQHLHPKDLFPGRAAEYVRMSTDDQRYSIENQHDAILVYAVRHGLTIVRTYTDAGKSGLTIEGRIGLKRLMEDIQAGAIDFSTVLVYDVSRWGRFQDADEAAYYEQLCKRAGVTIQYCAEMFQNDQGITASIIKSIKRAMAAEYSRELSVKVFTGKCRLARMGYRLGGPCGYGLRRQLIGLDGRKKAILKPHEHKALHTDRVVLVPGPAHEVKVVRWIFKRFAKDRMPVERIVDELNARGIPRPEGTPWRYHFVMGILSGEKYIGNNVFNRVSLKLGSKAVQNRPEDWIRVEGAFPSIVPKKLFEAAARRLKERKVHRYSIGELMDNLRRLLRQHGKLSVPIIEADPKSPKAGTYVSRFGSMVRAFQSVGYSPSSRSLGNALRSQERRRRDELDLAEAIKAEQRTDHRNRPTARRAKVRAK